MLFFVVRTSPLATTQEDMPDFQIKKKQNYFAISENVVCLQCYNLIDLSIPWSKRLFVQ